MGLFDSPDGSETIATATATTSHTKLTRERTSSIIGSDKEEREQPSAKAVDAVDNHGEHQHGGFVDLENQQHSRKGERQCTAASVVVGGSGSVVSADPSERQREGEDEDDCSSKQSSQLSMRLNGTWVVVTLILTLGLAAAAAFIGWGTSTAYDVQADNFERSAVDLVNKIRGAWEDYVNAASIVHNRCRKRDFTRQDFRELYEYLIDGGLDFQAAQFDPNITREERAGAEEEARLFYAENYPHVEYRGIVGFETENSTEVEARSEQGFYFPIHYMVSCPVRRSDWRM